MRGEKLFLIKSTSTHRYSAAFEKHRYHQGTHTAVSKKLARRWLGWGRQFFQEYRHDSDQWMLARREFWQAAVDQAPLSLRTETETLARDLIKPHLGARLVDSLAVGDVKILVTMPGTGEQDIHCDVQTWLEAEKVYTVLLYLNGPIPGTCLPKQPFDTETFKTICFQADVDQAKALLTKDHHFQQTTCNSGDWLVLQTSVPHYGPLNTSASPRWVLFMQFRPPDCVIDSDDQRYPHGIEVADDHDMQD
jgi:hypothetical protein